MEKIKGPRQDDYYRGRSIDCEQAMDIAIRDLVDAANNAGWDTPDTLAAIRNVTVNQRLAYEEDPDPAADPS